MITKEEKMRRDMYKSVYNTGGRPKLKCKECGAKFPYSPKGRWREFCSVACRMSSYRARKKKGVDNQ